MTSASIAITPLERRYEHAIDDLMFHSYQVHTHLDWYEPIDWLDRSNAPVRLAWQGDRLAGLMAMSLPLSSGSWLRIAALHDAAPSHSVMHALWQEIVPELRALGTAQVSALVTRNWIKGYLRELGFQFVEDVITLQRTEKWLPNLPDSRVQLRAMQPGDEARATVIDQAAFTPPWQMTLDELRQARRMAELCTVAELDDQIVGFQISTLYRDGAHLARLAVDPQVQSRGIGTALLNDVLRRFLRRGIQSVTVNTQISNLRSQRLYRRYGFRRNGYDLPVWAISLPR